MTKKKSYLELLKDPKWQRKRLEILSSRNFQCENCGNTEDTLHVHHGAYLKGKKPWEYDDNQYHVLCEGCHDECSSNQQELIKSLARLSPCYYPHVQMIIDAANQHESKLQVYRAIVALCGIVGLDDFTLTRVAELERVRLIYKNCNSYKPDEDFDTTAAIAELF